jgi:hypothetical protein
VNLSDLQHKQLELPIAGLGVLGTALLAGDPVRMGLVVLMGALWMAIAWKARLSLVLVAF